MPQNPESQPAPDSSLDEAPGSFFESRWFSLLLLLLTFLTTSVVGARLDHLYTHHLPMYPPLGDANYIKFFPVVWLWHNPWELLRGIPFSVALMTILLAHEMGHYLACRRYGVAATLPYFIPAPTLIGTMGAFIQIRSPFPSRRALFHIGIAGPIAGFLVALPVAFAGLALSLPVAEMPPSDVVLGFPLAMQGWHLFLHHFGWQIVPAGNLVLHPLAVAGWTGFFATALNLLPMGQLDGGHIVYALSARAHWLVSRLTVVALLPMAWFGYMGWLIWAVALAIFGLKHPFVAPDDSLGRREWALAAFALLMLVLCFVPAVFDQSSLQDFFRDPQLVDWWHHLIRH